MSRDDSTTRCRGRSRAELLLVSGLAYCVWATCAPCRARAASV
ncbi:hypothetical protein I552_2732 [Mycobacterium xenopi 3993]|nr:hypothetical protein I552_2732 [Mycobacterium xenopi 3993]